MKKVILILTLLGSNFPAFAQEQIYVKFKVDGSSLKGVTNFGVRGSANLELCTSIQVRYWTTVLCSETRPNAKRGTLVASIETTLIKQKLN